MVMVCVQHAPNRKGTGMSIASYIRNIRAWIIAGCIIGIAFGCAGTHGIAVADAGSVEQVWAPHFHRKLRVVRPHQVGSVVATWYGPGFWGHRTGCGSTLRRKTWGIAHRTLPCGQMVALRFKGRKIAVPVVDRGPYSGAGIDLTERTAEYLGVKQHGVGSVNVRVLRRRVGVSQL